mgnify:FL=1|jgi:peptide deformylase
MELVALDNPLLKKQPEVFDFENDNAKEFATDLMKKMIELKGIGLSANQVGEDKRVFCMGVKNPNTGEEFNRTLFNPLLIGVNDETSLAEEGCLSMPGFRLHISRPTECTIKYFDLNNKETTETFLGLAARVALHEYDHMLGLNFTSRASKLKLDRAIKSLDKKVKRFNRRKKENDR